MNTEKKDIEGIQNFLRNEDFYVDEQHVEDLIAMAVSVHKWRQNVGYRPERCEHNPREKAFADQWMKDNTPRAGYNFGQGILQDLFIENLDGNPFHVLGGKRWITEISDRERWIVATIIQWLGSNVGMAFLHSALARINMRIIENKNS